MSNTKFWTANNINGGSEMLATRNVGYRNWLGVAASSRRHRCDVDAAALPWQHRRGSATATAASRSNFTRRAARSARPCQAASGSVGAAAASRFARGRTRSSSCLSSSTEARRRSTAPTATRCRCRCALAGVRTPRLSRLRIRHGRGEITLATGGRSCRGTRARGA